MTTISIDQTPNILGLFSKAVLPKAATVAKTSITVLPDIEIQQSAVQINPKSLREYNKVCGFTQSDTLSCTYPHILSFPLQLSLLTHKKFPFPLLGLVHLNNKIKQQRSISYNEVLDYKCYFGKIIPHPSGTAFEVITEVYSAGNCIWSSVSTYLYKHTTNQHKPQQKKSAPKLLKQTDYWQLADNLGRRYAKVSGDFNPIHIHPLSAKLFGFKKAIVHGMWTKAHALAELQNVIKDRPFEVMVEFKLPVFIPSKVRFNWEESANGIEFQVIDELGVKPHLKGELSFL